MHTDQLVKILAHGAGPAPRSTGWRAMGLPLAGATALALAGGVAVLGAVPASDFATPAPWMKLGYTGLLAWALGLAALHAGLPARPWRESLFPRSPPTCWILSLSPSATRGSGGANTPTAARERKIPHGSKFSRICSCSANPPDFGSSGFTTAGKIPAPSLNSSVIRSSRLRSCSGRG